jgi:hypothetical protein
MNGICGIRISITPCQGLSFGSLPNRRTLPYAIDFGFSTQGKYSKIIIINRSEKGIKIKKNGKSNHKNGFTNCRKCAI